MGEQLIEYDYQVAINTVRAQRNDALDQVSLLSGRIAILETQIVKLRGAVESVPVQGNCDSGAMINRGESQ